MVQTNLGINHYVCNIPNTHRDNLNRGKANISRHEIIDKTGSCTNIDLFQIFIRHRITCFLPCVVSSFET